MAPGSHLREVPRPGLVVVDDQDTSRAGLARALTTRYGTDYSVLVESSPVEVLQHLRNLGAAGEEVAVILANQEMGEMPGAMFLSAAHEIHPRARRGLLISPTQNHVARLVTAQWGYVLTGAAAHTATGSGAASDSVSSARGRVDGHTRLLLETNLPGVFAIGDVRQGSVKRVAAGVGEGSICIRLVHEYLEAVADQRH